MKVILGGNSFIDCQALLAYQGRAVLRVLLDPVRVALSHQSLLSDRSTPSTR